MTVLGVGQLFKDFSLPKFQLKYLGYTAATICAISFWVKQFKISMLAVGRTVLLGAPENITIKTLDGTDHSLGELKPNILFLADIQIPKEIYYKESP
ncbi:hypothetical protein Pint_30344 [Pistacia integerrima]|uniref:Uncharacterized protein n=1 Tax=Pistacia integerrima TaxID=434235 RepID=A0ACC0X3H9_9ROSI|nr:hypothetical protein Pint_30344 [Pistacia integerrima]